MPIRGQRVQSPLKRMRLARNLSMREVSVYSGVSYPMVQTIDRLEPGKIEGVRLRTVMKVAMLLECSPADLIPFLSTRVKGKGLRMPKKRSTNTKSYSIHDDDLVQPGEPFGTRVR